VELAVDIAADGYGSVNRHDIAFFDQELTRLVAQFADLALGDQAAGPQLLDRPIRYKTLV
jgi:hypothetical protein